MTSDNFMATEHNFNVSLNDLLSQAETLYFPPEIKEGLESKIRESFYYIPFADLKDYKEAPAITLPDHILQKVQDDKQCKL